MTATRHVSGQVPYRHLEPVLTRDAESSWPSFDPSERRVAARNFVGLALGVTHIDTSLAQTALLFAGDGSSAIIVRDTIIA